MYHSAFKYKTGIISLAFFVVLVLSLLLAGCTVSISPGGTGSSNSCQGNCTPGTGVQGVQVFVEPDAGAHVITDAIRGAKKSVWVEIYLLTNRDVRVMLEPHPFGGGSVSPTETMDRLRAAGIQVKTTNPNFALTHEKGMIIDGSTAYIMTANFTASALGGSSSVQNREYGVIDTNPQDVQAVINIFSADWDRTDVQLNDPNLVVSPINSRSDFASLINSAHNTLLIEAEEMQDSAIEQAIASAAQHGVHVQVILPAPNGSSGDSNSQGIAAIKQGGVQVREDPRLYMHAKIIVVDGKEAFVGSENISTRSLDQNRELGILVSDQNVLNTLQQTFQSDWGDSQSV